MLVTTDGILKSSRDRILAVERAFTFKRRSTRKKKKFVKKYKFESKPKEEAPKMAADKKSIFSVMLMAIKKNYPVYLESLKKKKGINL